ncbi:MAG: hemerythrin domain-containing protein [Ignavibacteriales bacterium]|nr:MAG: hemerythrin domain-containing protein [Ignavibacteriales bacterium]
MMRHKALTHLSQEHHQGLILAQLLKPNAPDYSGLPRTISGKTDYAIKFYSSSLAGHFIKEEVILYPLIKGKNPKIDSLFADVFSEHKRIGKLVEELKIVGNHEKTLYELGQLLEAHIRKEERILFPLIQELIPAEILQKLEEMLNKK